MKECASDWVLAVDIVFEKLFKTNQQQKTFSGIFAQHNARSWWIYGFKAV